LKSLDKVNVMHVVLSLVVGGMERLVVENSLRMDPDRFNVEVCCLDELGHFSGYLMDRGVKVTLLQRNQHRYDYFYPFRLRSLLRTRNIHVMQMHSGTFFLATQAGVLARTPAMVYTDHGRALFDSRIRMIEDRISGWFVHKVVAVSRELEQYLVDVVKLPANKTITVINGIDTSVFTARPRPESLAAELGISPDHRVVGTVGRLDEVKDQVSMIEAFKLVHDQVPQSVLLFVGDGPQRSRLQDCVGENKLDGAVIFAGNRRDVPELLNLFDIFVLSSLSEGTSISLLEAMASGLPAVVTDVGGNPSIVDNMVNGIVVKPKKVPQIAEAVLDLLSDYDKRRQFGLNAAKKVRDRFSIDRMVEQYTSIYLELLSRKRILN
jgi:sugar transferase (PEP-CTERM/EpsH1 system associated)